MKYDDKKAKTRAGKRSHIGKNLNFEETEAFKLLRTNLTLSIPEGESHIIGITSSFKGEGKTTTSVNIAYSLADMGYKTLLIEADMRLPKFNEIFKFPKGQGLSNLLVGSCELKDAVKTGVFKPTLAVLTAGDIPPNPAELLSSAKMRQVLDYSAAVFDYVILDFPPINMVSDSLALAKLLSGMVLVVRANYCDKKALAESVRRLEFLKVKVLGFVMNGVTAGGGSYKKKYGYGYGYGNA